MSNQNLFEQNYDFAYFMSLEQQIISDSLSTSTGALFWHPNWDF